MQREAPAMKVRQNLGELINAVQYRHDHIVITKAGKPVAAMVDMNLYERIRRMDEEFAVLTNQLADAFTSVPESEANALLDEAVRFARKSK